MNEIVHLLEDSPFAPKAMRLFEEAAPGRNLFLVNDHGDPTVASRYQGMSGAVVGHGGDEYGWAIRGLQKAKWVFAHNLLSPYKVELIRGLSPGPRVHWLSWGGDLYCAPRVRYAIYGPRTWRYLAGRLTLKGRILREVSQRSPALSAIFDRWALGGDGTLFRAIQTAVSRIDSASAVVDAESALIAEHFSSHIQYFPFVYGSLEDYVAVGTPPDPSAVVEEDSILIGNSAYPSNNHVEAFESLAASGVAHAHRIVVPLSYGDLEYARYVIQMGRYYFGSRLEPLTQTLPLDQYLAMISRCRLAIMNQARQQAVGNLIALLYLGKSIFMHPRSPVLHTLRDWGVELFVTGADDFSRQPDVQRNQTLLATRFARAEGLRKIAAILRPS